MNLFAIAAASILTLSFLSYGVGYISLFRFKIVGRIVLIFLTFGVLLDICAISIMLKGSNGHPCSLHGLLGYLAFLFMLFNTVRVWQIYFRQGIDYPVLKKYLNFAKLTYIIWLIAYFTGSLIVIWK